MKITIDISGLTIGDLRTIGRVQSGKAGIDEAIDILQKVTEEDIEPLPVTAMGELLAALNDTIGETANPRDDQGNSSSG